MKRKIINRIFFTFVICVLILCGCTNGQNVKEKDKEKITSSENLKDSEICVVKAGDAEIFLDEVRYYVYNTQATYEVYYMTINEKIDWNSEMSEGTSMEEAAKSMVLDGICERVAFMQYAKDKKIELTSEENEYIEEKVDTFFADTNPVLLDKINIEHSRMKEVFTTYEIAKKVKGILESERAGKSEDIYKNWKVANSVTTNLYWDELGYETPIFEGK